jgi:hypothetical protein
MCVLQCRLERIFAESAAYAASVDADELEPAGKDVRDATRRTCRAIMVRTASTLCFTHIFLPMSSHAYACAQRPLACRGCGTLASCMHVMLCYVMLCYVMLCYVMLCYACMYVCMRVCIFACMYVCMYACLCVCMYVCLCVCMYACLCVCVHVCMLPGGC